MKYCEKSAGIKRLMMETHVQIHDLAKRKRQVPLLRVIKDNVRKNIHL